MRCVALLEQKRKGKEKAGRQAGWHTLAHIGEEREIKRKEREREPS